MKRLALILTVVALGSVALGDYFFSNGATSKSLDFLVRGPTGEPNLVLDTETDLDLYCTRVGDSRQKLGDLTLSDGVAADWNDLECIHLGNGHYRVDIPDANLANGIGTTLIYEIIDTNTTNTFDQAWVVVHLNAPVDTTAWKGTAVATPKTAGKPAVEVNEVDGYAVNAGAAITVAAAVGQTATAAANIEEVYVAHYATDWNDVTNMWSVDVNAVRGASPMSTTDVTAAVPTLSDIGDKVVADMDANATAVDAVLANSAQGGAAAVLTLDSLIISNADGVGVTITGTSDGILVTGTAGDGVHFMSSGSNGHGLTVAGNGSGDGMNLSTGSGQGLQVSSSSGVGVQITGTDAMTLSGTDDGLEIAGGTGNGIETTSTGASAVYFHAGSSGNGDGLTLAGYGAGEGLGATGGATGNGIQATGGATSGDGIYGSAQNNNDSGMQLVANGTGDDLAADNLTASSAPTTEEIRAEMDANSTKMYTLNEIEDNIQATMDANSLLVNWTAALAHKVSDTDANTTAIVLDTAMWDTAGEARLMLNASGVELAGEPNQTIGNAVLTTISTLSTDIFRWVKLIFGNM